ncbi:hypothetical protein RJ639_047870 [Escallonia herrerae]|uniref:Uncharacterized protein n=1 Tax=Escallonia herrerae TaxID=1293975 RepID=A0AA88W4G6_9ASTE|nr:hypothetical protein RJ639_047870 [Escallonia herrerae]
MVIPVQKVWVRVAKRLGIRKTGLVKLHHDVRTCEYEDVHVLWEMLKKNETEIARSAVGRKQGQLWNILTPGSKNKTIHIERANSWTIVNAEDAWAKAREEFLAGVEECC